MSVIINASTSSGLVQTADTSGTLELQSNGTPAAGVSGSNFQMNSGYGSVATAYGCRAWVNFNGTGTVAIRASGNVSSITDNGTGDYTVNFTTAMPDANYSVVFSINTIWGSSLPAPQLNTVISSSSESAPTTTSCRVGNCNISSGTTGLDPKYCNVSIFR